MAVAALSRFSQSGVAMALAACELVSFNALEGTVSFLKNNEGDDGTGNDEKAAEVDEEEQELSWLKDAGCARIADSFEGGDEDVPDDVIKDATQTLTKKQTAAVVRRIRSIKEIRRQKSVQSQSSELDDTFNPNYVSHKLPSVSKRERAASAQSVIDLKPHPEHKPLKRNRSQPAVPEHASPRQPPIHVHPTDVDPADEVNPYRQVLSEEAAADGLPDIVSDEYMQGLVHVDDLMCSDRDELRKLAHIELAAIFDAHKIRYARRKPKRFRKSRGIFGIPLKTLIERDQKKQPDSKLRIPVFFDQLVSHLRTCHDEKGILRIPGLASGVKSLRQEIDEKFMEGNFQWDSVPPHDGAGLLKQFVRDLPQPLLTIEHLDAFVKIHELPDVCDRVLALNLLILILPDIHRDSLQLLLTFLHDVVMLEANSMDVHGIGTVMAPNLFYMLAGTKCKVASDIDVQVLFTCITIVKMMVKYHNNLWTVPEFMSKQLHRRKELQEMARLSTMVCTQWYL